MNHSVFLKLSVCFSLLALASCATIKNQVTTEPVGWVAEQQTRQQINSWEIRGRLGIQTETNGGTLDVIWKQTEQNFSIRFIAPLGAGTYLIKGDSQSAEIRYPDGAKKIINNIDNVFSAALEVDLPAHAIKDWVRGLPAKALPIDDISWNEQGLLNTVEQSGWSVEMKKYTGNDVLLPHIIYLSRDDSDELDIRLVLRQWVVGH